VNRSGHLVAAIQQEPLGETRSPTDFWSGLGFSKSMPDSVIRDRLRQSGAQRYLAPSMETTFEVRRVRLNGLGAAACSVPLSRCTSLPACSILAQAEKRSMGVNSRLALRVTRIITGRTCGCDRLRIERMRAWSLRPYFICCCRRVCAVQETHRHACFFLCTAIWRGLVVKLPPLHQLHCAKALVVCIYGVYRV